MALPINIDDLVNARTVESVRIEFKKGWNPEEVIHTACAFANDINEYGGGYLIIGIDEKDGLPILPPTGIQSENLDKIQKEFIELCYKIQPNIFPLIEPIEFQGVYIVVIWVTTGEERPYDAPSTLGQKAQRRKYVRPSSVTIPTTKALENQLDDLSKFKHFDDRVNTQANLADLDLGLIQSYLQEIKSNLYEESLRIPFSELLTKMQLVRGPIENLKPLNVALLLFCKSPAAYFPGCSTNIVEFLDEAGTDYSEKPIAGPIHQQIRQILDYLNASVIREYVNKDQKLAESKKFANYPFQALEEAVVNALYHRSYSNPTPNEIRIYKSGNDRRIEIISYPGPLPPIDENALVELKISARNYRNLKLGDWLKNLRLAEKYATGIPTIVDALSKNGSPAPILSTDEQRSHFIVVFKIHPDTPEDVIESMSNLHIIPLNNDQQELLELLIDEPKTEENLIREYKNDFPTNSSYLIQKGLISQKVIGGINLYFINKPGREALRSSF